MKTLDLFAGMGWHLGATALGIEEEGVEIMPEAVATRDAIGAKTVHDDVWTYDYELGSHEGLIASPPCQSFSMAGKGAGRKALDDVLAAVSACEWTDINKLRGLSGRVGDDRTALVLTPLHAWWVMRPEWVAWEQVPTVQPVWDACAEIMRDNGYSVWTGRLQAEQYGVPQTRKRSILIASRVREVGMPTPTHSKYCSHCPSKLDEGVEKWMSMAEALGWGFRQRPSYTYTGVSAHAMGDQEWGGASVRRALKNARDSGDSSVWLRSNYGTGGDPSKRGQRDIRQPAPTVTSKIDRAKWSDAVRVEVHEAGLLQSFPADMPWQGSKSKQYLQIGNAVPPGLAIPVLGEAAGLDWQDVNSNYRSEVYAQAHPEHEGLALRNNTTANAAERQPDQPAPTLYFGQRANGVYWKESDQ